MSSIFKDVLTRIPRKCEVNVRHILTFHLDDFLGWVRVGRGGVVFEVQYKFDKQANFCLHRGVCSVYVVAHAWPQYEICKKMS